jgi:hypothetical protein
VNMNMNHREVFHSREKAKIGQAVKGGSSTGLEPGDVAVSRTSEKLIAVRSYEMMPEREKSLQVEARRV